MMKNYVYLGGVLHKVIIPVLNVHQGLKPKTVKSTELKFNRKKCNYPNFPVMVNYESLCSWLIISIVITLLGS